MAKVTIEGSTSPSAYLARGKRAEVQRTDHVERLIGGGFVVVIDEDGQPEPPVLPEPVEVPSRSASTDTWREFVAGVPGVEVPPDADRAALIEAWDTYTATNGIPAADTEE